MEFFDLRYNIIPESEFASTDQLIIVYHSIQQRPAVTSGTALVRESGSQPTSEPLAVSCSQKAKCSGLNTTTGLQPATDNSSTLQSSNGSPFNHGKDDFSRRMRADRPAARMIA